MFIKRISKPRINIRGDMGSPCLVDLWMSKFSEICPLLATQLLPPLKIVFIHFLKFQSRNLLEWESVQLRNELPVIRISL